jgi:hypothetical protein
MAATDYYNFGATDLAAELPMIIVLEQVVVVVHHRPVGYPAAWFRGYIVNDASHVSSEHDIQRTVIAKVSTWPRTCLTVNPRRRWS